jgi:hypothetical protein
MRPRLRLGGALPDCPRVRLARLLPARAPSCLTLFLLANCVKAFVAKALSKHFHSKGYLERMQEAVKQVRRPGQQAAAAGMTTARGFCLAG